MRRFLERVSMVAWLPINVAIFAPLVIGVALFATLGGSSGGEVAHRVILANPDARIRPERNRMNE